MIESEIIAELLPHGIVQYYDGNRWVNIINKSSCKKNNCEGCKYESGS